MMDCQHKKANKGREKRRRGDTTSKNPTTRKTKAIRHNRQEKTQGTEGGMRARLLMRLYSTSASQLPSPGPVITTESLRLPGARREDVEGGGVRSLSLSLVTTTMGTPTTELELEFCRLTGGGLEVEDIAIGGASLSRYICGGLCTVECL